ncbi:MAG: hypothetical protein ACU843_16875, partial [Gammaproteobacteria bacterium]
FGLCDESTAVPFLCVPGRNYTARKMGAANEQPDGSLQDGDLRMVYTRQFGGTMSVAESGSLRTYPDSAIQWRDRFFPKGLPGREDELRADVPRRLI